MKAASPFAGPERFRGPIWHDPDILDRHLTGVKHFRKTLKRLDFGETPLATLAAAILRHSAKGRPRLNPGDLQVLYGNAFVVKSSDVDYSAWFPRFDEHFSKQSSLVAPVEAFFHWATERYPNGMGHSIFGAWVGVPTIILGMIGEAWWHLGRPEPRSQYAKEVAMLAQGGLSDLVSAYYIFTVAGAFARAGRSVTFIPERGGRVPDLEVVVGESGRWRVEVTATRCQSADRTLREALKDALDEKAGKFPREDGAWHMVAVDCTGIPPVSTNAGMKPNLIKRYKVEGRDGALYPVCDDPDFWNHLDSSEGFIGAAAKECWRIRENGRALHGLLFTQERWLEFLPEGARLLSGGIGVAVAAVPEEALPLELATRWYRIPESGVWQTQTV